MKGAFLFVDAGKGHYVPARALADAFLDMGNEAVVENLFVVFKFPLFRWIIKHSWRFMLHHPRLEWYGSGMSESKPAHDNLVLLAGKKSSQRHFKKWFMKERPDFLLTTHFMGETILSELMDTLGIDCPVYDYAPDLFDQVRAGIDNKLTMCYISTPLGVRHTIKMGQDKDKVKLCPFPLSKKFEVAEKLSKEDARKKLGLRNMFTVLWNLGGEGIGSPKLLYGFVKRGLSIQVVVIGGKSRSTQMEFDLFKSLNPDFPLEMRGFVDNAEDYIMACDLQMGKAGANSLMESFYLKRPFLVSEVLYMGRSTQLFFEEYPVGWCENNVEKQIDIIEKAYNDKSVLEDIDKVMDKLPVDFSAPHFASMLVEDTLEYRKKHSANY